MPDLADQKRQARAAAAACRSAAHAAAPDAGRRLCDAVLAKAADLGFGGAPVTVSLFHAMGTEIDTLPLFDALIGLGHATALPVVVKRGAALLFRAWRPGEPLVAAGFGTREPAPDAPTVRPDVMFVPLLAFDARGLRLGYGGGFYDRTIAALRSTGPVRTIGIGYAAQRLDRVPAGPHDEALDWLATETGVWPAEPEHA